MARVIRWIVLGVAASVAIAACGALAYMMPSECRAEDVPRRCVD